MAIPRSDQTELVLPLFEDLLADAPWDTFLTRLMVRTGADRGHVLNAASGEVRRIAGREWGGADGAGELTALGGPDPALRPNRVYALDELRAVGAEARAAQDAVLAAARIGDARMVRIGAPPAQVWLVLLVERGAFAAADSALLTNLAPAVALAAHQHAEITRLRLRVEAAEESLGLLGIGQAVLGADGTVRAADPLWQVRQPQVPMPDEISQAPGARQVGRSAEGMPVLLRPLEGRGLAVVSFRLPRREAPQAAARVLVDTLGLSPREASLAALLSQGLSLIEAGRELRLTDETARNYSKRIYAKTGASGQADLVRIVLTGLAPLA